MDDRSATTERGETDIHHLLEDIAVKHRNIGLMNLIDLEPCEFGLIVQPLKGSVIGADTVQQIFGMHISQEP